MRIAFYKGTHKGLPGVYNRLVRWWTKGIYSHCELVFDDGLCGSSSFMDGGVRFKTIDFNLDKWDIVEISNKYETDATIWFATHQGDKYDIMGNIHLVVGAVGDDKNKWFCNEAVAAALGIIEPWRFDPNSFSALVNSTMKEPS